MIVTPTIQKRYWGHVYPVSQDRLQCRTYLIIMIKVMPSITHDGLLFMCIGKMHNISEVSPLQQMTIVREKEGKLLYKHDKKGDCVHNMYKIDEDGLF